MGVWSPRPFGNDDAQELAELLIDGKLDGRYVIDRIAPSSTIDHLGRTACAALIAARYDPSLYDILNATPRFWLERLAPGDFDPNKNTVESAFVHLETLLVDQEWLESFRTTSHAEAWCVCAQRMKDSLERTLAEWEEPRQPLS